jgi:Nickel responsive protein SCO4226-like
MKMYAIRRRNAWESADELEGVAGRSKEIADSEFPQEIRWIRSYVIAEADGTLGSVCIYEASDVEAVRKHAARVDMPADEIDEIADTVVIRPDPAATSTAG